MTQKDVEHVSVNYNHPSNGPTIMDEQRPLIKVIIRRQEVAKTIADGGLGVNVINKTTCDKLGITKWDACPFWLRMVDTSTIRPLRLIRQLDVILVGHTFQLLTMVLHLDAQEAYTLLLGRPWLKTANIKQNWNKNVLTFRKGKTEIRISTQEKVSTTRQCLPVHTESIIMMEGLDEAEED